MPLDVQSRTCATIDATAGMPTWPERVEETLDDILSRDLGLQFFPMNTKFQVGASHQLASIESLPFVHTALLLLQIALVNELVRPDPVSRTARFGVSREDRRII